MDLLRIEQVETNPQKVASRVKRALKDHGFGKLTEFPVEAAAGDAPAGTLVVGYATELAPRAAAVAPEAPLLLVISVLLRASGEGTQFSILDPQVLSVVPDEGDLSKLVEELRGRTLDVIEQVRCARSEGEGESGADEGIINQDRASELEQRLYALLLEAIEGLFEKDVRKNPEQILLLSKAYAVVASLKAAEEIELHLA